MTAHTPRISGAVAELQGIVTPLVTPIQDGAVDYDCYGVLIERQIKMGVQGILVNGTSAEPSTLTVEERKRLLEVAVGVTQGRIAVVAGTGTQSLYETELLTQHACSVGANAVLVVTPYYVRPPQRGLVKYFSQIGSLADLPVLIYHIPSRAAVSLEVDTVLRIREEAPNVMGMKHSSYDLSFLTELLAVVGSDFRIFGGMEELSFPMLMLGAVGLMNAVGNVVPDRLVHLWRSVETGEYEEAARIHRSLYQLNQAVMWDTNPIAVKYLMMRLGLLVSNESRLPMVPATPELAVRLDELIDRLQLT